MPINLLYIHGFNSSPKSHKALLTGSFIKTNFPQVKFIAPQIENTPQKAIEQLEAIIASKPREVWCCIGSSLGGFYSAYLSEKYGLKAVLVNPAVRPYHLIDEIIGEHTNPYTSQTYLIENQHIEELINLEQKKITKNNYLVMVQTGDEVLDYQQAVDKYHHCQLIVQSGGDHSFIEFDKMLPSIASFLGCDSENLY